MPKREPTSAELKQLLDENDALRAELATAVLLHNFKRQLLGALLGVSGRDIKPYPIRAEHSPQNCLLEALGFGRAFLATRPRQNEIPAQAVSQNVFLAEWRVGGGDRRCSNHSRT